MLINQFPNLKQNILISCLEEDVTQHYDINPMKIGEGNDSVVYTAVLKAYPTERRAIKKVHRKYIQEEDYINTEISILKQLDHPAILKLYQVFDDKEYISLVTEQCKGPSLMQYIKKQKRLSEEKARLIFIRILDALSYCHSNKVMHRDLKPDNIMFSELDCHPESLKIIDFGMSFQWHSSPKKEISQTYESNKIVGTIYYMSPQVLRGSYDQRADIWSLGVILYLLVSGRLPFSNGDDHKISTQIKSLSYPERKLLLYFTRLDCLSHCSLGLKRLIRSLLQMQQNRLTIEEIYEQSWIQKDTQNNRNLINLTTKQSQSPQISINHPQILHGIYLNILEFHKMSKMQMALKVFFSYNFPMLETSSEQIFNQTKNRSSQEVEINTLIESWKTEAISFDKEQAKNLIFHTSKESNQKDRKISQIIQILTTFKDSSISYSLLKAWVSESLPFEELEIYKQLQNQLMKMPYGLKTGSVQNILKQINKILVKRQTKMTLLKKRAKTEVEFELNPSTTKRVSFNVVDSQKVKSHQQIYINEEVYEQPRKKNTIKQNIWESLSPTFKKKSQSHGFNAENMNKGHSRLLKESQSPSKSTGFGIGNFFKIF